MNLKSIINNIINKYESSEEYARRCLLNINKSIYIELEEKYIHQGLLALELEERQEGIVDYNIILHISTDFVRTIDGNYDFVTLTYIHYKLSIDKFGKYWNLDRKSKIYNLFNCLLECSNRISLNINFENCILYEIGTHRVYNEVLKQYISNYSEKSIKYIKSDLKHLKGSSIHFIEFSSFDCLNLLDFLYLEQVGIKIYIENFILELGKEINERKFNSEISILNYYLANSSFTLSVYLFDFVYLDLSLEYTCIFKLLSELYELIRSQKLNLKIKPYANFSFLLDDIEFSDKKYYNRFRKEIKVYEDTFNFKYFDTYLGMILLKECDDNNMVLS